MTLLDRAKALLELAARRAQKRFRSGIHEDTGPEDTEYLEQTRREERRACLGIAEEEAAKYDPDGHYAPAHAAAKAIAARIAGRSAQ